MSAPIQKTVTRDEYIATRTATLRAERDRLAATLADPSGVTGAAIHELRGRLNGIEEELTEAEIAAGREWSGARRAPSYIERERNLQASIEAEMARHRAAGRAGAR